MQPVEIVTRPTPDGTQDFWDRYVARIQAQGIKPPIVRWYVIRTEHYLRTVTHPQLADHTPQDVTAVSGEAGPHRSPDRLAVSPDRRGHPAGVVPR